MKTNLTIRSTERTAIQAYAEKRQSILALAAQIGALLRDHGQNERIDWAHVGDMAHIEEQLKECVSFLGGE